jgi:nucleotide sugar dehydrogenase
MKICIVGLGEMGISLLSYYSSIGHKIIGVDINKDIVFNINNGKFEKYTHLNFYQTLKKNYKLGLIKATTDWDYAINKCDVIMVIVPLLVNKNKKEDYSPIIDVSKKISSRLRKGILIIYETTLPMGGTKKVIKPLMENRELKCGDDFWVVYSPERASPQNIFFSLKNYPKIVGGINRESTKKGIIFYKKVLKSKIIGVSDPETAEAIKLFGMVYRDVNIALANEFAKICHKKKLNVSDIINMSNTNPHSKILSPGAGVGGHCIPIYPYFLINESERLGVNLSLTKTARKINESMPFYLFNLLKEKFKKLDKKRILILGLGYKENSKQYFLSPSLYLIEKLKNRGAFVYLYDPLFSEKEIINTGAIPTKIKDLTKLDILILITYNKEYDNLNFKFLKKIGLKVVFDGRNLLKKEKIISSGIRYIGI